MASFLSDNDDLKFYFDEGIDWSSLVRITEYDFRSEGGFSSVAEAVEFYRDVAEMVGKFVAEEVAPHAALLDREGVHREDGEAVVPPKMNELFERIAELDLHGMCVPRELGGMNCPMMLYFINTEMFARADVSVCAHHGFHGGIAMAMLMYSIVEGTTKFDEQQAKIVETRFQPYIEDIMSGRAWGTMDITEPDAGSDMAALRTKGELDADGNWLVTGEKIFITSGHGKYHFVIARTEESNPDDPFAGLGGLSLFLVPTYEEDGDGQRRRLAPLERVEEKLGHHGSVTATVTFDRAPAHLIGKRGEGFKHMLTLMNNARVGVGFESIGLCEAAYRLAIEYAAERKSMGKTIDRHEMIADYLRQMRTDIQGIRALAMYAGFEEEMAQKESIRLQFFPPESNVEVSALRRKVSKHKARARRMTPLLKYLAAEKCVEMTRRCIQIHGGNGYMKEYGAEKLLRDAIVMPIYEGTSQIQALMAMKDTLMGIMKDPRRFASRVAQARYVALASKDPLERRVARVQQLSLDVQQTLIRKTAFDKVKSLRGAPVASWSQELLKNWNPKRDFAFAMLHAEKLTLLLAHEAVCEVLLSQAKKHPSRKDLLERYLEYAEPVCRHMHDAIKTTGERVLAELANES